MPGTCCANTCSLGIYTYVHVYTHTHTPLHLDHSRAPRHRQGRDITFRSHMRKVGPGLGSLRLGASLVSSGTIPKMHLSSALCCATMHSPLSAANTRKGSGRQKGEPGFLIGVEQGNELQSRANLHVWVSASLLIPAGGEACSAAG